MIIKTYQLIITEKAMKDFKKIDHQDAKKIIMWMNKNLSNCNDPRVFGKALVGNKKGLWRYRVGNYRIISVMTESVVSIEGVTIGHRKDV